MTFSRRACLALWALCVAFSGAAFAALPGAPTKVVAMPRDGKATVSFEAPALDGGSLITNYTVTSSPGGITASGNSTRIVVPGLANGTAYTFTVRATNGSGLGPPSAASNSVRPIVASITPAVSTYQGFALALDAHGQVYAWGSDPDGQLGQSRARVQSSPFQVPGLPPIQHIAMGEHVLAVDTFGQVWSWGDQCNHVGPRDSPMVSRPGRLLGVTGMSKVAAMWCASYALKGDGTVWRLGVGAPVQVPYPVPISDLAAGPYHLLALGNDQRVYALGNNDSYQIGDGTTTARTSPFQVPGVTQVTAIAAGIDSSLALTSTGDVYFWGKKNLSNQYTTMPTLMTGLGGPAEAIGAGSYGEFWVARKVTGTVWRWDGTAQTLGQVAGMVGIGKLETMTAEAVVFGISGSTLTANGSNKNGELAQGHVNPVSGAVAVPGFGSGTAQVAAGYFTRGVLARKTDGTVWFWAENEDGQRGDSQRIGSAVPLAVPIPATIKKITSGYYVAAALDTSGQVWGWGDNLLGAINPDWTSRATPELIPGISNVSAFAVGGQHFIAYAKANGEAWISGWIRGVSETSPARQVAGLANVVDVAGTENTAFFLTNGAIYALGTNAYGEIGDGTTTTRTSPVLVQGLGSGTVAKVAGAGNRVMAMMTDGRVFQWGADAYGTSLTAGTNLPTQVPGITTAADISVSRDGALIRLANGSLRGVGASLVAGSPGAWENIVYPIAAFPEPIQAMSLGRAAGFFVGPTGLTWGWGTGNVSNYFRGLVGDGTYVERGAPVVVLAHAGGGGVDTHDWYLDLKPESLESIPAAYTPNVMATAVVLNTDTAVSLEGIVRYRSTDLGKNVSNYVFGLVPPQFLSLVPTAANVSTPKALRTKAAKSGGYVLVQLTPGGWADVTGQLLPFSQGLASAGGAASNILNGIPPSQILGSRFCIGYGETADAMLSSSSLREVLVLEGAGATSSGMPCVLSGVYVDGPRSSVLNSPVTFTASVVGIAPTGGVQFRNGASALGSYKTLSGSNSAVSTAQIGVTSLPLGTHSILADYSGDSVNPPASSEIARLHAVSASSETSIQGRVSSEFGAEVAFVATVTGSNPSGAVQFKDGGVNLGEPIALTGGLATLRTSSLPVGAHSITAAYAGDGNNAPSTSPALSHTVLNVLPTRVSIGSSANPVNAGSPLTVNVTVSGPGATPAGSVTLRDWENLLETRSLAGGSTSFDLPALPGGLHAITAHYSGDGSNPAATSNTLFQDVAVPAGMVSVTAAKIGLGSGTINSNPAGIDCGATCTSTFLSGSQVSLTASPAAGSDFLGWEGATQCGGNAVCTVTVSQALTLTAVFRVRSPIPRLSNISTRMRVETGDNVMIGGFVIGGTSPKTVVVRARGPSMAQAGVPNLLANPQVQLFKGSQQIAFNDDWQQAANAAMILASGFAPNDVKEAAILATLDPGGYTAIVSGAGASTGVGIVEVFEVDGFEIPLINIATRGRVQTGDNVMIGGFVIQGSGPQTVVVRARGPSLAQAGVPGVLPDPVLQLYSGATVIASNDDWQQASNASAITASGFAPSDGRESAILMTLQPGAYTAIVTGAGGSTGVAIIEVFRN